MAEYYLVADASWWAVLPPGGIKLSLYNVPSGKYTINSITLPLAKVVSSFPFRTNDYSSSKIQPTQNNISLSAYLTANTSDVKTFNRYSDMQGSGESRYSCWAPTTSIDDEIFNLGIVIDSNNFEYFSLIVDPLNSNNVLTMSTLGRAGYPSYSDLPAGINVVGKVDLVPYVEDKNPTSISLTPTSGNDNWITNTSGALRNSSNGIYKDYNTSYKLSYSPSDAKLTSVNITTNGDIKASYNKTNQTISVSANNYTTNYPSTASFTVSVNGGASASTTIKFYEKPLPELTEGLNESFSIGNVYDKHVTIKTNIKSDQIAYVMSVGESINTGIQDNFFSYNYRDMLSMTSNFTNKLKIENEGIWQTSTWRYYNKIVQSKTSIPGTYKYDIAANVRYYITPNDIDNFSYDYIVYDHVITENIPKVVILVGDRTDSLPSIGNLSYNNNTASGGYCRGFKISFNDSYGNEVYSKHINATINGDHAKYNGNVLNNINLSEIPFHKYLTITITMYFYFDDSPTKYYYGASYEIPTLFYRFTGEDLLPTLKFPKLNKMAPYTKIMLPDVERFGYRFYDEVVNNFGQDIIKFGIDINNKKLMLNDTEFSQYFSSVKLENIVFNIGKYIIDNNSYTPILNIRPFVVIFPDTDYSLRIYDTRTDDLSCNATLDTSKANIWNRPTANKGEIIKFYNYANFYNYINKYIYLYSKDNTWTYLNPGYIWEVPELDQGDIINTDYWNGIANVLDQYSKNMQKFATDPTNFIVLWALPKFKHKKGEIINNNNLKQNFYDLLLQYSNYDTFATHNYLNENNYTYDMLDNYTHNQITNKEL